jgi:hypothetical protein
MGKRKKPYFIYKVKKLYFIKNVLSFDTEAYIENEEIQKFRLAVCLYKNKFYIFTEQKEFLDWFLNLCKKQKKNLYVIAHNIRYDLKLSGLLNLIKKNELLKYSIEPFFLVVKFNGCHKKVIFLDLRNIYDFSLREIGNYLGIEKLEIGNPNNASEWNNIPLEKLIEYCKRDTEIVYKAFMNLQNWLYKNKLGNMGISLAQLSFNIYRYKFLNYPITHKLKDKELDREFFEVEKSAYYGARTELFFKGYAKNVNIYDINSLYPFVMANYEYPVKKLSKLYNISLNDLEQLLNDYCIIAKVKLNLPQDLRYGIFPIRLCRKCLIPNCSHKTYSKLFFPIGKFSTLLTSNELALALKNNYIENVEFAYLYVKKPIFKDFINYFYERKKNAKKGSIDYLFSKLIMNSLYGKFAQQKDIPKFIGYSDTFMDYDNWYYEGFRYEQIGYNVYKIVKKQFGIYSFPAIASHITANARLKLFQYMQICKNNLLYVDTDSLFVYNYQFPEQYVNNELGNLKQEYKNVDVILNAPKDYVIIHNNEILEEKIKGIPKFANKIYDNLFQYWHLKGFKTMLKDGKDFVEFENIYKSLKRQVIGIKKEIKNEFLNGILIYPIILK